MKYRIEVEYADFILAYKTLSKLVTGNRTKQYACLSYDSRYNVIVLSIDMQEKSGVKARFEFNRFRRCEGFGENTTLALPLSFLANVVKRIKQNMTGSLKLTAYDNEEENENENESVEKTIEIEIGGSADPTVFTAKVDKVFSTVPLEHDDTHFVIKNCVANSEEIIIKDADKLANPLALGMLGNEQNKKKLAKRQPLILFEVDSGNLNLVSTNGEKLVKVRTTSQVAVQTNKTLNLVVTANVAQSILTILQLSRVQELGMWQIPGGDLVVRATVYDAEDDRGAEGTIYLKTQESKYTFPEYRKVMPDNIVKGRVDITASLGELLAAIATVEPIALKNDPQYCILNISNGLLYLCARHSDDLSVVAQACNITTKGMLPHVYSYTIGINIEYLKESAVYFSKNDNTVTFSIRYGEVDAPVLIHKQQAAYLVMPVKLSKQDITFANAMLATPK